jgi:hypothetical protein
MATNAFNNVASISKMAMDCLENNLTFTKFVNRQYDDQFRADGAKNGDSCNIRIPGTYSTRSGSVANPQGYNDSYKPLTLSQYGVDLAFTTKELRLNIEDGEAFKQNVLNPMIAPLANLIDQQGTALLSQIYQATGTPGTAMTDLQSFLDGGAVLDEAAVPRDGEWSAIMAPRTQSSIVGGLKTLFNPNDDIAEQYRNGTMGRLAGGFKFSMDQNITSGAVGTRVAGTSSYASGATEGGTSIVASGGSGNVAVGDIFTIAGVYKVNPVSKLSTGQLQQFVVTAASAYSAVSFQPPMYTAASGPLQNITALPSGTPAITYMGAASAVATNNVVFHKDAFGLVCVDLPKPEGVNCTRVRSKKLNVPLRMIQWYNGTQDTELYRLDVLFGWSVLRPTFAARVLS